MKLGADPQPILFGHSRSLGDVSRMSFFVTIENSNFQSAFAHPQTVARFLNLTPLDLSCAG